MKTTSLCTVWKEKNFLTTLYQLRTMHGILPKVVEITSLWTPTASTTTFYIVFSDQLFYLAYV
jgi:hypothetical protein